MSLLYNFEAVSYSNRLVHEIAIRKKREGKTLGEIL